jgi:hypothetical protein
MTDLQLGEMMQTWMQTAGLPIRARVSRVTVRRLRQAYPVYVCGYEKDLTLADQWLGNIEGLLTFGRQGLFVHDNTHHALYMANAASKCIRPDGCFDTNLWAHYRQIFETHVVED